MKNLLVHMKLIFVVIVWGFGWPAGRVIAQDIAPFAASWIRYVVAVALFVIYLKLSSQWMIPTRGEWKRIAWIGFFATCLYQAFFMVGMKYTAAGDASLMITFNPFFTAVLAIFFLNEAMHWRLGAGIALGLAGVTVLFLYSPNVDIPFYERALGDVLIAGAAFAWACNSIQMKIAMTEPAVDSDRCLSPLQLTVWSSVIGLVMLTPIAAVETAVMGIPEPSFDGWVAILFLAIFSTVVSYVWFADGILTIGAGKSALYVYLVPIFGIYSGYLLLDEKLGASLLVAFVLIVGGVALAQSKQHAVKEA
ncbi:DMT family transporter [Euryarchaeota archaeon]|nr:DMT family transporter [Euryarchaeota archaeon]MDA8700654.1 DMT family transporter [Euryarchaeota archaeon]MDA8727891.1 DMT family transporter [Euryarchaeota archaeon]MDA9156032.1 DMT family transporter [Candidatus Poseidoniaceae archaeon]MDB2593362.1 DMT family transporter [Euryarchaeota archaeon]